jgi:hypothetical protein
VVASAVDNGTLGVTGLSGAYTYYATSGNEIGESVPSAAVTTAAITLNHGVTVTITNPATAGYRFFNVYRSPAGGSAASAKFIGRVVPTATTTVFTDLGNKVPGFVTGYLLQDDGAVMKELAPYSRLKLAVTELSSPECNFTFKTLAVVKPRQFCLVDNIRGQI